MLYLATSPVAEVRALLDEGRVGLLCAPGGGGPPKPGWVWAADNGCYRANAEVVADDRAGVATETVGWDAGRWLDWLDRRSEHLGSCLFATVPDVVGDAEETLRRFETFAEPVRAYGYPVALVAQDGLVPGRVPWDEIDALFVGGTTVWKLSEAPRSLVAEARERGLWVHVGRINSGRRYRAWAASAESCDGTFLARAPSGNVPRMLRWFEEHEASPQLWD